MSIVIVHLRKRKALTKPKFAHYVRSTAKKANSGTQKIRRDKNVLRRKKLFSVMKHRVMNFKFFNWFSDWFELKSVNCLLVC